jgi:hypothetical protein
MVEAGNLNPWLTHYAAMQITEASHAFLDKPPYDVPALLSYSSRAIAAPKRTRLQREHSFGLQVTQRPEHLSWLRRVGYLTRFLLQRAFEATLPSLCAQ